MQGNIAAAEGAFRAGCRFYAGYPISPSNQVMSRMASLLAREGTFVQMEDEIASISAVIGASWTGAKAMTATSGPGLSLMLEGIGYAYFTETPLVIIDVQRAGPATGQATHTSQGDVMQYRFGAHGDVYPIALAPWSVQEMYDLTVRAFDLSETYRVPVFVAADQSIASARETMIIPRTLSPKTRHRALTAHPFGSDAPDGVPPMPAFGDGARLLITGSTHDAQGMRRVDDPGIHEKLVQRLMNKTQAHINDIVEFDTHFIDDAETIFFAYGISARAALSATKQLRADGHRVGLVRPTVLWPFSATHARHLMNHAGNVIVPELNTGMIANVLRKEVAPPVHSVGQTNGEPIYPNRLMDVARSLV